MEFAKPTEAASPPAGQGVLPLWPMATTLAFAAALAVSTHYLAAWILHLNAVRAVAEALTASMVRNDAAARAGRERRPLVDPLNPYTWTLEPPKDDWIDPGERARMDRAAKQLAFVEIAVLVWRRALYGVSAAVGVAGLAGTVLAAWRRGLLLAVAVLTLLAAALTVVGMRLLTVYGGFESRPAWHYVGVAVIASMYGWWLIAFLVVWRRRAPRL